MVVIPTIISRLWSRDQQTFSVKGQIVNSYSCESQSAMTTHLVAQKSHKQIGMAVFQ